MLRGVSVDMTATGPLVLQGAKGYSVKSGSAWVAAFEMLRRSAAAAGCPDFRKWLSTFDILWNQ